MSNLRPRKNKNEYNTAISLEKLFNFIKLSIWANFHKNVIKEKDIPKLEEKTHQRMKEYSKILNERLLRSAELAFYLQCLIKTLKCREICDIMSIKKHLCF